MFLLANDIPSISEFDSPITNRQVCIEMPHQFHEGNQYESLKYVASVRRADPCLRDVCSCGASNHTCCKLTSDWCLTIFDWRNQVSLRVLFSVVRTTTHEWIESVGDITSKVKSCFNVGFAKDFLPFN